MILASGFELVERVENSICGPVSGQTPAFAQGLARSGRRASSFRRNASGVIDWRDSVGYVDHVESYGCVGCEEEIVLLAGSHQAAIDQTLVAHLIADALSLRVTAVMGREVALGLGLADIPDLGLIQTCLEPLDIKDSSSDPLTVVEQAFQRVEATVGRPCRPLQGDTESGELLLVTLGSRFALADHLARRSAGQIHHLSLSLLRPFPETALNRALAEADTVAVVADTGSSLHRDFLDRIKAFHPRAVQVDQSLLTASQLADRLSEALSPLVPKLTPIDIAAHEEPDLRLSATPAGPWSRQLLLQAGGALALPLGYPDLRLKETQPGLEYVSLELSRGPGKASCDLLYILLNDQVDPTATLRTVREGGDVILHSQHREAGMAWAKLPRSARLDLLNRGLKLWWFPGRSENSQFENSAEASSQLADAALFILSKQEASPLLQAKTSRNSLEPPLTLLDPGALETALGKRELDFSQDAPLPRLAGPVESEIREGWITALRCFHLTGEPPLGVPELNPDLPISPAAVIRLASENRLVKTYPVYLPPPAEPEGASPLSEVFDRVLQDDHKLAVLGRVQPAILELIAQLASEKLPLPELFGKALSQVQEVVDLSPRGEERLSQETEEFLRHLPRQGQVVTFSPGAWLSFYTWAIERFRKPQTENFRQEAQKLVDGLDALLRVDRNLDPQSRSPERMASAMGSAARSLIDAEALSHVIPARKGSMGLSEQRRKRIKEALAVLEQFLKRQSPSVFLVHSGEFVLDVDKPGFEEISHAEPFDTAMGLFEGLAAESVEVFKALRVARLEVEDRLDPTLDLPTIDRLSWESCEESELDVIPVVLVFETTARLARRSLAAFNRTLRRGSPLQVVLITPETVATSADDDELSGVLPDFGYLGVAHREAFVLQSSLSRPGHLLQGLETFVRCKGPAVCLLAEPGEGRDLDWVWRRWISAHLSRSLPAYRYDPSEGDSWADRFSLEGNESPHLTWVTAKIPYVDAEGHEQCLAEPLTFAHVAAQDPKFRRHYCVIPAEAWSDEQVNIGDYLDRFQLIPPRSIPFIWSVDEEGALHRVVVTREIVNACRDRQRSWKVLQELAGINNAHVLQAVASTREEINREWEGRVSEAVKEARAEGAAEAVDRIVALFTNPVAHELPLVSEAKGQTPSASLSGEPATAVMQPVEDMVAPEEAEEDEKEEDLVLSEAYIDSYLCTSCNDCINLNPRMFKYNDDKQAFLADPDAGTYAELVKAAEVCPANCIHPGAPRSDDATATQEVVERAQAFL